MQRGSVRRLHCAIGRWVWWLAAIAGPLACSCAAPARYWAFRPVARPPLPAVRLKSWVLNPVDAHVLAGLEAEGLTPSGPAERAVLIRRLSFDLLGLPPLPEEVEAFVRDTNPGAYERLVDRFLASAHYGERWARRWLDVVRFAESQGFERDKIRDHAWRYRDYVIRAFNQDKPYDQFVREQIAGDVIPGATQDSVAATGFLVAGPWDEVGATQSSVVMRARVREDELEDMVSATGQTFLGLTVNCARCHDHKFDPIPQADYYAFQAALAGVRHGDRTLLPPAEQEARESRRRQAADELAALEARAGRLTSAVRDRVRRQPGDPSPAPIPLAQWTFERGGQDEFGRLPLAATPGLRIEGGRLILPGAGPLPVTAPTSVPLAARTLEAWVSLATLEQGGGGVVTVETPDGVNFDSLVFGERRPRVWEAGSEGFQRSRDVGGPPETRAGPLIHVAVTYAADGWITLYRDGQPYGSSYVPGQEPLRRFPAGGWRIVFGVRHTVGLAAATSRALKGELEEARLYDRDLSAADVAASYRRGPDRISRELLLAAMSPEERRTHDQLAVEAEAARRRLAELSVPILVYGASPKQPEPVRLLKRGDVGQPGEPVAPAGLSCVGEPAAGWDLAPDAPEAERRRRLADWIAHPRNPLTARVIANRVWQHHFGVGIVGSPSDFGVMGERPTHPALLDYLADYLKSPEGGPSWTLKKLHRLIVCSNSYRQSARPRPECLTRDADNRLVWRMTPRRLEAEELRDALLRLSGRLNPEMFGPGFRPFTVTIANTHFYQYEDREGKEYERRSIYRTVVNSGGIPLLEAFDCPDPSVKTPRRGATITPLQALSLQNDSFVMRMARRVADELKRTAPAGVAGQVGAAGPLLFCRRLTPPEQERYTIFAGEHGLAALVRVLINSNEFVFVR